MFLNVPGEEKCKSTDNPYTVRDIQETPSCTNVRTSCFVVECSHYSFSFIAIISCILFLHFNQRVLFLNLTLIMLSLRKYKADFSNQYIPLCQTLENFHITFVRLLWYTERPWLIIIIVYISFCFNEKLLNHSVFLKSSMVFIFHMLFCICYIHSMLSLSHWSTGSNIY
jgi:hypothetical protein